MATNSFIENVNALANATSLATGDIVTDTQAARDEAVTAATNAATSETEAASSEALAKDWANKGHNNPVTGTAGIDAKYSSYHWATEASVLLGDPVINDLTTSSNYTWSSTNLSSKLGLKSDTTHRHDTVYEQIFTKNTAFNKNFTVSGAMNGYADTVSRGDHAHNYEPTISVKNTAFNKNFGTVSGTVAEGDHTHSTLYMPKVTTNTAYNKNFVADVNNPGTDEIPRGNHVHPASGLTYDSTNNQIVTSTTVQGAITQLDASLDTIAVAEKTKLTAGLTDTDYIVVINTANTPTVINGGMTVGANAKNALYSNGVRLDYTTAPDKLVEGQWTASISIEVLPNKHYYITPTLNGTVIDPAFRVELGGSAETVDGTFSATISGWISGLVNTDTIGLAIANITDTTNITVTSLVISWAGQPEGALVISGATVDHSDITGTGAANGVHTISDIENLQTTLDTKADKLAGVAIVENNLLAMDINGNLKDSGISITDSQNHMNLVATPTLDNIVTMTSGGDSKDSGTKIADLATLNGSATELFHVQAGSATTEAINFTQFDGLSTTVEGKIPKVATPTLGNFPQLAADGTLVNSIYDETSFAPTSHTHPQTEIINLVDDLANKYDKVATPVTDNIVIFEVGDTLKDSNVSINDLNLTAAEILSKKSITDTTFTNGFITRIDYVGAVNENYETITYNADGVDTITHYLDSTLAGTTTYTYTSGQITSITFS